MCVLNGVIHCLVVNQQNRGNITCQLAGTDMQHGDKKNRDKENSDMSGGGDHKLIAGIVGSLIVLLLVAIFVVLLVQILRKRRHGHTPPGKVTHMQQLTQALLRALHVLSRVKVYSTTICVHLGEGSNRGMTNTYTHRFVNSSRVLPVQFSTATQRALSLRMSRKRTKKPRLCWAWERTTNRQWQPISRAESGPSLWRCRQILYVSCVWPVARKSSYYNYKPSLQG